MASSDKEMSESTTGTIDEKVEKDEKVEEKKKEGKVITEMIKAPNVELTQVCPDCLWMNNPKVFVNKHVNDPEIPRIRAGVFFYDRVNNKLLVVQTYHAFVGLPKGGREKNETLRQTALRELKEETGIVLPEHLLRRKITLHGTAHYFIIVSNECPSEKYHPFLYNFEDNDVTGVGWIHPQCLYCLPGRTTSHLRMLIERVIHSNLP